MPKQKTDNHTPAKQFRLGEQTLARIDLMAADLEMDRTAVIRQAVREMHIRWAEKKRKEAGFLA